MSKLQYLIHFDILFYVKSTFTTFKSDVPLSQTLKHIVMKTIKLFRTVLLLILFITSKSIWSQENKLAIFDLHSINIMYKGEEITRLLRMEAKINSNSPSKRFGNCSLLKSENICS